MEGSQRTSRVHVESEQRLYWDHGPGACPDPVPPFWACLPPCPRVTTFRRPPPVAAVEPGLGELGVSTPGRVWGSIKPPEPGGPGKGAQLTGPFISCYELWR